MPPDLNSLPASNPSSTATSPLSQRPRRISINSVGALNAGPPSPRSPTLSSLQAAAAINAGLQRSPSGGSPGRNPSQGQERRRSSLMNNLLMNDPATPAPGELQPSSASNRNSPRLGRRPIAFGTADPNHQRQPSLGEIHQELENEQEAQVNRLLHMIRIQQDQIAQIQRQQQQDASSTSSEQTGVPTPPSTLNTSTPTSTSYVEQPSPRSTSMSGLPHSHHFNRPHSLSRQSSTRVSNAGTNSRSGSPALRPASGSLGPLTEDFLLGGTRDESAFYQAETQMLTRENQMLKQRIRELERQISDLSGPFSTLGGSNAGGHAHSPAQNSPLSSTPATFAGEVTSGVVAHVEPAAKMD